MRLGFTNISVELHLNKQPQSTLLHTCIIASASGCDTRESKRVFQIRVEWLFGLECIAPRALSVLSQRLPEATSPAKHRLFYKLQLFLNRNKELTLHVGALI